MTDTHSTAPGWYPDPNDNMKRRWWDGTAWGPYAPVAVPPQRPQGWFRRHLVLVILGACAVGLVLIIGLVGVVAVLASGSGTSAGKPDYQKLAKVDAAQFAAVDSDEWDAIVKDPDSAKGKRIAVYAQVSQFDTATGSDAFLAGVGTYQPTSDFELGSMSTMFRGTSKALAGVKQDDVVKVLGQVAGTLQYDTKIGGTNTVPLIDVARIEKVGFADLKGDVKVGKLVRGQYGEANVELTVTNSATRPMSYNIKLSARNGSKAIGEAYANTPTIAPGASVKIDADGFYDVPQGAKIQIDEVDRYAN